ncbi:MAG TPA: ketoacyl-ACP synthase III [Bacteroidia bacterium]|nr:ketoacyl-ACP synthase III [Bacteroidia bacterium]
MHSYIKAISYYLPEKTFSNEDFFDEFPEALPGINNLQKIGVKKRHIIEESQTASDLAVNCAIKFFKEHNISPHNIDFLLFCSLELDYYTPATACVIHQALNLPENCGVLDFNHGCSGYVYGLSLAKGLIESVGQKNVLLITSSSLTKKIHNKDKSSRFVFGDGAAATLIAIREDKKGIGSFVFGNDGGGADKIIVRDGGGKYPISETSFKDYSDEYGNVTNDASFYMNGTGIFLFGVKTVPKTVLELLEKENKTIEDIDLFIFHQANLYLINTIATKLSIPNQKIFNFMENVGNTVSSTIPIALYEAMQCGKAKKGDTILLVGFGVGLSWAATTITL